MFFFIHIKTQGLGRLVPDPTVLAIQRMNKRLPTVTEHASGCDLIVEGRGIQDPYTATHIELKTLVAQEGISLFRSLSIYSLKEQFSQGHCDYNMFSHLLISLHREYADLRFRILAGTSILPQFHSIVFFSLGLFCLGYLLFMVKATAVPYAGVHSHIQMVLG